MEAQGKACLPPMSASVNVCKCPAPGLDAAKVSVSGVLSALEVARTESSVMGFMYEKPRGGRRGMDQISRQDEASGLEQRMELRSMGGNTSRGIMCVKVWSEPALK